MASSSLEQRWENYHFSELVLASGFCLTTCHTQRDKILLVIDFLRWARSGENALKYANGIFFLEMNNGRLMKFEQQLMALVLC